MTPGKLIEIQLVTLRRTGIIIVILHKLFIHIKKPALYYNPKYPITVIFSKVIYINPLA